MPAQPPGGEAGRLRALIGWRIQEASTWPCKSPGRFNPLDHAVFQVVFGGIMTVLIALEFGHALQYFFSRGRGIIQAKIVIVIALLAIARKVIVTDPFEAAPASVLALAALTLALGVTYWLMRERDDRRRTVAAGVKGAAPGPKAA